MLEKAIGSASASYLTSFSTTKGIQMRTRGLGPGLLLLYCLSRWAQSGFGQGWTPTSAPKTNWNAVACSADGTKIVAVASSRNFDFFDGGPIYFSVNSGADWTQTSASSLNWTAVGLSADGTRMVAGAYHDA